MTAHEEQDERVVVLFAFGIEGRDEEEWRFSGGGGFAIEARTLAAHAIGHAARGNVDEPGARIVGEAFLRPLICGGDECILHRVLGGGEVAEAAKDGTEHLRREVAEEMLGGCVERRHNGFLQATNSSGGPLMTWRTSMGMTKGLPSAPGAEEARAAISCARCSLSTSTIQ